MNRRASALLVLAAAISAAGALTASTTMAAQGSGRGTIDGHVRLLGKLPGNPVIRMRRDPLCAKLTAGKQVVQETVVAALDGSLANVFVRLEGTFSDTPVPSQPVIVDQRGCIYSPRVVGLRLGQTLEIRNSDDLLHNVHSLSGRGNGFNIGQPIAGMVYKATPKEAETMLRLSCDIHSWMTAYVGIVNHPYFGVTAKNGAFDIRDVPTGRYTLQAWHELYGELKQTVVVTAGGTATADFKYSAPDAPAATGPAAAPSRRGR